MVIRLPGALLFYSLLTTVSLLLFHLFLSFNDDITYPAGRVRRTSDQIHQHATQQMYDYCRGHGLIDAWVYLYTQWYTATAWRQWARSAIPGRIPAGKTMMFIEAHWKVLKRNHLYRRPHARLDMLVYVIITKHVTKLRHKFMLQTIRQREPTRWEYNFVSEWRSLYQKPLDNPNYRHDYVPSTDNWTCGCKEYLRNRFLLCKHLVRNAGRGIFAAREYFILCISTSPFFVFTEVKHIDLMHLDFKIDFIIDFIILLASSECFSLFTPVSKRIRAIRPGYSFS